MLLRLRTLISAVAVATLVLAAPSAASADARVLDDDGRVLTVGNWRVDVEDDGTTLRVPDSRTLSWELRDGADVVAEGVVPGTDDGLLDAQPALSRDPETGALVLVWSRQTDGGTRELAAMPFAAGTWLAGAERVIAEGTTNQLDPTVLHDATGHVVIAWRDADSTGRIMLVVLDRTLGELAREELSAELSIGNGPPLLGVDARGVIFAAFAGREPGSTEPRVFVLSTGDLGGGVLHNPLPILDLTIANDQPLSGGEVEDPTGPSEPAPLPRLHATVLAGTAVVWWEETADDGTTTLRYLHETLDQGWAGGRVGTITLPAAVADPRHEALRLLEDRMRRIVARFRSDSPVIVNPNLGRSLVRR